MFRSINVLMVKKVLLTLFSSNDKSHLPTCYGEHVYREKGAAATSLFTFRSETESQNEREVVFSPLEGVWRQSRLPRKARPTELRP
jgi:hypothetical protein